MATLNEFRKVLTARAGNGGIIGLSRAFRILDDNGNRQLNLEEFAQAAGYCGVPIGSDKAATLMAEIDRDADGNISIREFLRALRGPMSKPRLEIIAKAWAKFDKTGDGIVSIDDLAGRYDAKRHPEVLKGEKTEHDIFEEFLGTFLRGSSAVTSLDYDDFLNYYAGVSANIDSDAHFYALVQKAWRLDQPSDKALDERLKSEAKTLFASSAYKDVPTSVPALESSAAVKIDVHSAIPIADTLDPFPVPKPGVVAKGLEGKYEATPKTQHKVKVFRHGHEVVSATQRYTGELSTAGKVPGVAASRGFLTTDSSTKTGPGAGHFDEDVMSAIIAGKTKEQEIAARRHALQALPFETAEPKHWIKSSHAHCNMTSVKEPTALMTKPDASGRKGGVDAAGPTGDTAVTVHSRRGLQSTMTAATPGSEEDLRSILEAQREAQRASLKRPKDFKGTGWQSTTHSTFADVDLAEVQVANDRWSATPALHASQRATSEATRAEVERLEERYARRHEGSYETETSVNLKDKSREVVVDSRFHARGTFSLSHGVARMNPLAHHPRDVKTGATLNPNNVVPDQFTTTTKSTFAGSRKVTA